MQNKANSFINITGLAIGLASSILILLWVQNELSYDKFHKNANQIYRLTCNFSDLNNSRTPAGMAAGYDWLEKVLPIKIASPYHIFRFISKPAS